MVQFFFALLLSPGAPAARPNACAPRLSSGGSIRVVASTRLVVPQKLGFVDDFAYARVVEHVRHLVAAELGTSNEDNWLIDLDAIYPLTRTRSIAYFFGLGKRNLQRIDVAIEFDRVSGAQVDARLTVDPRPADAREPRPDTPAVPDRLLKTIGYHASRGHSGLHANAFMGERNRERAARMNGAEVRRVYRVGAGDLIYVELAVTSYFEDGGSGQLYDETNRMVYVIHADRTFTFRASDSGSLDELMRERL